MSYNKILIAVDNSEFAMNAAREGVVLSRQLKAEVAFIFVVDKSKALGNIDAGILPSETLDFLYKEAEYTMNELSVLYNGKGLREFMPEGRPSEEVIKTAEEWDADLIVLGTHGRTGLKHLLMGSTAEEIIRHSTIPVMVVPSK